MPDCGLQLPGDRSIVCDAQRSSPVTCSGSNFTQNHVDRLSDTIPGTSFMTIGEAVLVNLARLILCWVLVLARNTLGSLTGLGLSTHLEEEARTANYCRTSLKQIELTKASVRDPGPQSTRCKCIAWSASQSTELQPVPVIRPT